MSTTATRFAALTEFSGLTTANASVAPVKILAMNTSARLTAAVRSTSPTKEVKPSSCRSAASSRSKASARASNSSRATAMSSATTTPTAEATTSAAQPAARTFATCQSTNKRATRLDDRITRQKKRRPSKTCPKKICDRSREKAALRPSVASLPASRHRRSLGNAAELK